MDRRALIVACAVAVGYSLAGPVTSIHAQSFVGKWVHRGPRGTSYVEFLPGVKKVLGPTSGGFRHLIILDDGKVIQGEGQYVFHSLTGKRGRMTLYFADGHVVKEHEHIIGHNVLSIRHHGVVRNYLRE